jgi:two-component system, NarL family, response regulator YdfI
MVRVLVAADSELARAGLEALVEHGDSLRVIGSSTAGVALPERVRALAPDVIVLEPPVLEDDAFALWLARVSDAAAGVPLILVGDDVLRMVGRDLLHAGVRGLLSYDATAEEIRAAVEAVAAGLVTLDPAAVDAMLASLEHAVPARALPAVTHPPVTPGQSLTRREIEVLNAVAEGLGNKHIAARLGISEHTVKAHLAAIFEKLDATSRTEAVTLGARSGIIPL